jgi:probable phosphoglycerate mutase
VTLKLILARHGNTFNAGDKVVFVGARNDLPLTEDGIAQAHSFGEYLARSGLDNYGIFSGPLQRARSFAEIARSHIGSGPSVQVDWRLQELDYGLWAGLSSAEIEARYGRAELDEWNKRGIWPTNANWPETEAVIAKHVAEFVDDLLRAKLNTAVVVSSNGLLRYFLALIPGAFDSYVRSGTGKVRTGHISLLEINREHSRLIAWDKDPKEL